MCYIMHTVASASPPSRFGGRGRTFLFYFLNITLLHCDAFRQIARLVHIGAAERRDVVREELERDKGENRGERFNRLRNVEDIVGYFFKLAVTFGRERNHGALARFQLLN